MPILTNYLDRFKLLFFLIHKPLWHRIDFQPRLAHEVFEVRKNGLVLLANGLLSFWVFVTGHLHHVHWTSALGSLGMHTPCSLRWCSRYSLPRKSLTSPPDVYYWCVEAVLFEVRSSPVFSMSHRRHQWCPTMSMTLPWWTPTRTQPSKWIAKSFLSKRRKRSSISRHRDPLRPGKPANQQLKLNPVWHRIILKSLKLQFGLFLPSLKSRQSMI